MNERARLVDSWRQLTIFANALLGTLNVEYHLNSLTPAGQAKPLAFSGSASRHQLVMSMELPLVRLPERNNYRASLIAYQRQRRNLMAAEDGIVATVRQEVRQLRQLAENYRIQQRAVELAYLQVENSLETFRAPPIPTQAGAAAGAGTAAALTQQLLNAQRSLPQSQNALYATWLNFYTARMALYRDLELMPLDFRGVWNDESATLDCPGPPDRGTGPGSADPAAPRTGP
jgi:outer membrane protein TolC